MSKITDLVNEKVNANKADKAADEIRFIVLMNFDEREQLRKLAETLGVKQIKLASELFRSALAEAVQVAEKAIKAKNDAAPAPAVPPTPAKK